MTSGILVNTGRRERGGKEGGRGQVERGENDGSTARDGEKHHQDGGKKWIGSNDRLKERVRASL